MFFVSVRFSDEKVARLFDLARIIAQPDYARPIHITLRGPYAHKKDISPSIIGKDVGKILIRRPGYFFNGSQNTVYLGIDIFGISDFWRKPDYPDGEPHLSLYDGNSREFAWGVFRVIKKYPWKLSLNSTPMRVLESKQRLETEYLTEYESLSGTLNLAFGEVFSAEQIKKFSGLDRLVLLDRLCQKIHTLALE